MLNFFFSFHGRVRRSHYFLGAVAAVIASAMLGAPFLFGHAWRYDWNYGDSWSFFPAPYLPIYWAVSAVVGLACYWVQLALAAKRWHDANATGWLALLTMIPGVHVIVFLILCLIPPTAGPNQYGADPRLVAVPA